MLKGKRKVGRKGTSLSGKTCFIVELSLCLFIELMAKFARCVYVYIITILGIHFSSSYNFAFFILMLSSDKKKEALKVKKQLLEPKNTTKAKGT